MTVIAAYLDRKAGVAAMACDSEMTRANVKQRTRKKFMRIGRALVGVAGDASYLRFLETVDIEDLQADEDCYEWANGIVDLAFKFKPPTPADDKDGPPEPIIELELLFVTRASIYSMSHFRNLLKVTDDYEAVGSGGEVALGALSVASHLGVPADVAVQLAVQAGIDHGAGCGGKVHIEMLGLEPKPRGRRKKS